MSDQPKRDEDESGSKNEKPTFSRRSFLGVGGVGLASATGLAFAQRNGTNTTNGTSKGGGGQQNGSSATNSTNSNGSESENDGGNDRNEKDERNEQGEKSGKNENNGGNDKNEKSERNDSGERKDTGEKTDKNEVKPSQVSLSAKQARGIATKQVNGTVQSTDLGNQNSTPAYEVTVKTGGGSTKEIAVDANNGTVLAVGAED